MLLTEYRLLPIYGPLQLIRTVSSRALGAFAVVIDVCQSSKRSLVNLERRKKDRYVGDPLSTQKICVFYCIGVGASV